MQGGCQNGWFVSCWLAGDYEIRSCGWGSWKSVNRRISDAPGRFSPPPSRFRAPGQTSRKLKPRGHRPKGHRPDFGTPDVEPRGRARAKCAPTQRRERLRARHLGRVIIRARNIAHPPRSSITPRRYSSSHPTGTTTAPLPFGRGHLTRGAHVGFLAEYNSRTQGRD